MSRAVAGFFGVVTLTGLALAFLLFRLLDVLKPGPTASAARSGSPWTTSSPAASSR